MTKNQKSALFSVVGFVFLAILVFFVTSICLASTNDRSLIDEWKSWGGTENVEVVEEVTEESDDETLQNEAEVTTLSNVTTDIDDYSNVEIVA